MVKVESIMEFRQVVQKMQKMGNSVGVDIRRGYIELEEVFDGNIYIYAEDGYVHVTGYPNENMVVVNASSFLGKEKKRLLPYDIQVEIAKTIGDETWSINYYEDSTVITLFETEDKIILEDGLVKYEPTIFSEGDWIDVGTLEYIAKIMRILEEGIDERK